MLALISSALAAVALLNPQLEAVQRIRSVRSSHAVHSRLHAVQMDGGVDNARAPAVLLPATATRAALPVAGSALALGIALPQLPDIWSFENLQLQACAAPLCTLAGMSLLVLAAWRSFGTDLHPITAKARGLEPPKGYTFQVLGLSGALLASAALAFNWYPLPVAANPAELAHCALPFLLWQVDVRLLRWLNPHVEWPKEATQLVANYLAEHESALGAAVAWVGVLMFEVYVQQLAASPLTAAGVPVLGSAALLALTAGLLNHAIANGLLNGILCMEFYWTVSLMFSLSNSTLPVGIYHHLMYSMPLFVQCYDDAVESAPSPAVHALLLHSVLMIWHLAAAAAFSLWVPPAMELLPAAPEGLSLLPTSASAAVGLVCLCLFIPAAASVAMEAASEDASSRGA